MSTNTRSTSRRLRTVIAIGAIAAAMAGCSTSPKWGFPYKAPVQQGNWITSEQVALLRVGMTREQVRFALGSPTLTSVLHADRWDYPYYFKPGYGAPQERKFTVWFDSDKVARWDGDHQPDVQPFQLAEEQAKAAGSSGSAGNAAAPNPPPGASPAPGSTGTAPAPAPAPAAAPSSGATAPAGSSSSGLPAGVTSASGTPSDAASTNAPGNSARTTQ